MKRFITISLLALLLGVSCKKEGPVFEYDDPHAEADFSVPGLTLDNFPFIDCSTSTSPLRDMVMYKLLDIPYYWGLNFISGAEYQLYYDLPAGMVTGSPEHVAYTDRLRELRQHNGSHDAYVNLIDGRTDVIIDSRDISRNELDYSRQKGVPVEPKPLALDALVFIVHPSNRVKSLSQQQIRDIYTGRITNWKQVGGADHEIHPYMRDADSGSQEKMETIVMRGEPMVDMPEMVGSAMVSPYFSIENDEWGIGYTPYYYCERMIGNLRQVKVLAVDGVYPSPGSILGGALGHKRDAYPYYTHIYAAVRQDEPQSSVGRQLYRWLSTPTAKDIVDESGYISLRTHALAK